MSVAALDALAAQVDWEAEERRAAVRQLELEHRRSSLRADAEAAYCANLLERMRRSLAGEVVLDMALLALLKRRLGEARDAARRSRDEAQQLAEALEQARAQLAHVRHRAKELTRAADGKRREARAEQEARQHAVLEELWLLKQGDGGSYD